MSLWGQDPSEAPRQGGCSLRPPGHDAPGPGAVLRREGGLAHGLTCHGWAAGAGAHDGGVSALRSQPRPSSSLRRATAADPWPEVQPVGRGGAGGLLGALAAEGRPVCDGSLGLQPTAGREAWPLCSDSDLQTYWYWNLHSQFQGPAHGPAGELPRISGRVRLQPLAAGRPLPCAWGACMC